MKTLQVGELKRRFSEILDNVRQGEEIAITFGKKREKVAVIVPFEKYRKRNRRGLGVLEGKASCVIKDDFVLSDEELLRS